MNDFRGERIGVAHAARLLNVSVTDLKNAVQQGIELNGVKVPDPLIRKGGHYQWLAGAILDCAEKM